MTSTNDLRPQQRISLAQIDPILLGRRLHRARIAAGMRQADLTAEGVSVGYISRLESGQRRPSAAVLAHLAASLGVDVDVLLAPPEPGPVDGPAPSHEFQVAWRAASAAADWLRNPASPETYAAMVAAVKLWEEFPRSDWVH